MLHRFICRCTPVHIVKKFLRFVHTLRIICPYNCTCIAKRADLDRARFIDIWYSVHRQVAIETQSTFSYVRNEVVRALTPDAPAWDAIVEEGFPIEALDDPRVFYDAVDDEALFRENLQKMVESAGSFLDLERVSSHPMSHYV